MATIANMMVKVSANTTSFNKSMANAQAKVKTFGKSVSSMGTKLSLGLTAPLTLAGTKMLKLAMDAEETQNLFDVSLGKMGKQAEDFTKTLSSSLGLNQYELKRQVATLNDMTKSMGLSEEEAYSVATSMTELTQDLASFKNLDIEEAFNKIRSGITGESEPLKAIGILLNENTIKTWAYTHGIARQGDKLTEQQKVMARVGAIMEQTKDAQGDLARTSESATNTWRRLQSMLSEVGVTLGTELLPMFTKITGNALKMVEKFKTLSSSTRQLIMNFGLFLALLGPSLKLVGLLTTAFSALISPIGLTVLAIAGLIEYFVGWSNVFEGVKTFISGTIESLKMLQDGLPFGALLQFRATLFKVFGNETGQKIFTALLNIKNFVVTVYNAIKDNTGTILSDIFNSVVDFFTPFVTYMASKLAEIKEFWALHGEQVMLAITNMFLLIQNIFISAFEIISTFISDNLELIKGIFESGLAIIMGVVTLFTGIFTGDWEMAWNSIKDIVSNGFIMLADLFELGKNAIRVIVETTSTMLNNLFRAMFEGAFGIVKEIWKDIVDYIAGKVEWVMGKVEAVKKAIASIVNAKITVPKTTVSGRTRQSRDIPKMASGGIVTSPTLAMIGEGSESEAVIPLSKLGSMTGGNSVIQVILDGDVIAEKIDNKQGAKLLRMRGAY